MSTELEQLEFKLEKMIRITKYAGKVRKKFSTSKIIHICKWTSYPISTFAIAGKNSFCSWQLFTNSDFFSLSTFRKILIEETYNTLLPGKLDTSVSWTDCVDFILNSGPLSWYMFMKKRNAIAYFKDLTLSTLVNFEIHIFFCIFSKYY